MKIRETINSKDNLNFIKRREYQVLLNKKEK